MVAPIHDRRGNASPSRDGCFRHQCDASGSGEDTYYYHRNRQFSIIGLTDNTGTVIDRYAYTAYGEVTVLDANGSADADNISDVLNPYTYTGRRLDDETGLLYFRARYHDPVLGRFLERDPLGYPDGLNTYAAYHVMWGGVDPSEERGLRDQRGAYPSMIHGLVRSALYGLCPYCDPVRAEPVNSLSK